MRPLKFKQIRKSIINQNQNLMTNLSPGKSPLKRKLFQKTQNDAEMSFRSIQKSKALPFNTIQQNQALSTNKKKKFCFQQSTERQNLSPLSNKKRISQLQKSKGAFFFDSDQKNLSYQRITTKFGSDGKQNQKNSIYINGVRNIDDKSFQHAPLNFNPKQRKLNTTRNNIENSVKNDINAKYLYETTKNPTPGSLTKKNSSSMLFKAALQTSNKKKANKNNFDSQRSKKQRQSSIGKLKQKILGMKKVISQKQKDQSKKSIINGQQTNSFTIYTKKDNFKQNLKCNKLKDLKEQNPNFSDVQVQSSKNFTKGVYKNYMNAESKKQSVFNQVLMKMQQSRMDSVNVSLAESRSSILDMSPHLWN